MFSRLWPFKKAKNIEEEHRSDLHTLLSGLSPDRPFEERMEVLKKIMTWLRHPTSIGDSNGSNDLYHSRNVRLRFFLQYLDRHTKEAQNFFSTFTELTRPGRAVRLYCLTGIPENAGFFNELSDRIVQNILPVTYKERDLAELFKLIFTEDQDAEWFETNAFDIVPPFLRLMEKYQVDVSGLMEDQRDALVILGSHLASLGISKNIRRHLGNKNIPESSFIRLAMSINRQAPDGEILSEIRACRLSLGEIRMGIELSGVSVELIYLLEKIEALLNRVEMILYLRYTDEPEAQAVAISRFVGRLIRDDLMGMRVKDYLYQNLHMLTRKIVERAGDKGDAYIAGSQEERRELFVAASWAGVLTAFTALIKYWIGVGDFPLFFEGFFFFVNYAIGFLLMQRWHLALSSKQPAYMASALSKKFEHFVQTKELRQVILEVKKVSSSQFIAAVANLLWVVPTVLVLDWIWLFSFGEHIVSLPAARDIVAKHDLFTSMTIFYSALTGVLLWGSSVVAGWTENWIVFRNIHLLVRDSAFLKSILGEERTHAFSARFSSLMGGVTGNLSIAFFLAAPIIVGKITGLPLDIRHVTLATGTLTLALSSIGWSLSEWPTFLHMFVSVLVIGTLNFSVSFYLAIRMAAMARKVESKYLNVIFKFAFKPRRSKSSE